MAPFGKNLESACKAHANRELIRLARAASAAADRLFEMGGTAIIAKPSHLRTPAESAALAAYVAAENARHDYANRIDALNR